MPHPKISIQPEPLQNLQPLPPHLKHVTSTSALGSVNFLLPRALWPLCEWPGTDKAALLLTALLGGLIVWFTFFPPDTALFADLGGAVRTFLTIPV